MRRVANTGCMQVHGLELGGTYGGYVLIENSRGPEATDMALAVLIFLLLED